MSNKIFDFIRDPTAEGLVRFIRKRGYENVFYIIAVYHSFNSFLMNQKKKKQFIYIIYLYIQS